MGTVRICDMCEKPVGNEELTSAQLKVVLDGKVVGEFDGEVCPKCYKRVIRMGYYALGATGRKKALKADRERAKTQETKGDKK